MHNFNAPAGHLPLHWAVKHQASHEVVEKLLASQPGSAATKTQAYHLQAGKASAYRDRAGHGIGGQHIGGWPSVECRRSLQHGEHLRPFARWPPDDGNSTQPASTRTARESKPTEGLHSSATVRITFNDGPMGVKWTLPRSCDEPFRLELKCPATSRVYLFFLRSFLDGILTVLVLRRSVDLPTWHRACRRQRVVSLLGWS